MKRLLFVFGAVIALSGCGAENVKEVLGNLDKDCIRHYAGSFGTGVPSPQATVTFQIDCQPHAAPVITTTTP